MRTDSRQTWFTLNERMATEKGILLEHLDVCWINSSRRSFSMLGYVDLGAWDLRPETGGRVCLSPPQPQHEKISPRFSTLVKELKIPRNVNEFNIFLTLKSLVSLHKAPNREFFDNGASLDAKWMQFEDESARKSFITDNGVTLDWRMIFDDAEKLFPNDEWSFCGGMTSPWCLG